MAAAAAAFNLLGGIGTSCVALWPERFGPRMALLAPYRWLYVAFVVGGIATAVWEGAAVVSLLRRTATGLRHALLSLSAGLAVAGAHALSSQLLRGSSAPADMRAYLTAAALLAVVWIGRTGAYAPGPGFTAGETTAGGAAMLSAGVLALAVPHLMAATHTIGGANLAAGWPLVTLAGSALTLAGVVSLARTARRLDSRRPCANMPSGRPGGPNVTPVTKSS